MRNAGTMAADSEILQQHPRLKFQDGSYTLRIRRRGQSVVYSVTSGHRTISAPLLWAFGLGYAGQTYIYRRDGVLYESRVSYYRAISGLDITLGHARTPRDSLAAELGRPMAEDEVRQCFSCHTSGSVVSGRDAVADVHPGVTCEKCHGSGNRHVEYQEMGEGQGGIFNPGELAPAAINDFCGRCHRTTQDVLASNILDVRNVRFQPYRLENSRCYDPTDRRIDCLACHDPHRPLDRDLMDYDSKCLACHAKAPGKRDRVHSAPACPVSRDRCVTCHMPKVTIPGSHFQFTDHYIRIVHPGAPYPG